MGRAMPTPVDVVEALLFASDTPLEAERIRDVLDLESAQAARELVEEVRARYQERGLMLVEVGGGYRLVTRPELAPWLVKLARARTKQRLSRPALETLAIVAYKQSVSRPEVDAIRGVNSDAVLENLLERRLIRITGRKDAPGRPYLFETTREFLVAFGLRDLGELPRVEGQLVVPVVADLVVSGVRLYPVGRLDWDVEGALLLTNDGPLTHRLLHPRYALPRVYEALVEGRVGRADLGRWREGVLLEDGRATPLAVELLAAAAGRSRVRLTFTEGRRHEVKRYCEALGHRVTRLRRLAFGPIALGDLRPGASRRLTPREVRTLRATVAEPGRP